MPNSQKEVLLEVKNLRVEFGRRKKNKFVAVKDVNFNIYRGETFGLVGESGSGKTTIGRAIIRLNETADGEIIFINYQKTCHDCGIHIILQKLCHLNILFSKMQ